MDYDELKDYDLKLSSVVVIHEQESDSLVLTLRSAKLRNHPNEVCFPGGFWDKKDKTLYDTALRELHEEVGISADRVKFIKEMAIETTRLGVAIQPWLVTIQSIEPYQLNKEEVAKLILVPISAVKNMENYADVEINRKGYRFKSCTFHWAPDQIWGATARIMRQFAD